MASVDPGKTRNIYAIRNFSVSFLDSGYRECRHSA